MNERDGHGGQRDGGALLSIVTDRLASPPIGVILVEVRTERPADDRRSGDRDDAVALAGLVAPGATVVTLDTDRLAVVLGPLTAPAEAEATAHRLWEALTDRTVPGNGQVGPQAAIGVAVSRTGDEPEDLIRYADHALTDATMLGGDGVVPFDDGDRDLLLPRPDQY
ncbi:MAG: diguanylate cyclase [Actinomycetota bacterium]